jgi:hypothetical protein
MTKSQAKKVRTGVKAGGLVSYNHNATTRARQ